VGGFEEITISVAMSVPFTIAPFEKPLLQRLVSDRNMSVKEGWVSDKIKARQPAIWASGDYSKVAWVTVPFVLPDKIKNFLSLKPKGLSSSPCLT